MVRRWRRGGVAILLGTILGGAFEAPAQPETGPPPPLRAGAEAAGDQQVQLDFDDVELSVVIDTIARLTGRNFIYDDRVRGRVTIVSPTRISVDQAYAVFESVLQVKGFTTVEVPGGALKIIPLRDAKQSNIETGAGRFDVPDSDRFVTRLIPLRYIDAEAITNTLKPLVSNDAAMVAYPPTNTVILTDSATNIQRLLDILEAIDIESYKEELAVIRLIHADAATVGEQLSEIIGGEVSTAGAAAPARRAARRPAAAVAPTEGAGRAAPRIITDERTNSLIVLASRATLEDIRGFVRKIDVPVEGGGRIQVYYLKHADAEEISQTLSTLISGAPTTPTEGAGGPGAAQPQALRAAVTELAGGASVTADPGTNSLVIQASPEGYAALVSVIELLDIPRPQVLVEALIMEVNVTDSQDLGFNGIYRVIRGDTDLTFASLTDADLVEGATTGLVGPAGNLFSRLFRRTFEVDDEGNPTSNGTLIQAVIRASASDSSNNILSAPHILTSDNEEAEILVGDNIPIITSRTQQPTGAVAGLSSAVNVERQDIGITLRVTPQITEGDSLRLKIFQELTAVNRALTETVSGEGGAEDTGVALFNRRIENTVVVADEDTVVIGGLISDQYDDSVTKVPWLGDIPILGWLFKTTNQELMKRNLLVFLTPHIVRTPQDLAYQSIRKREEFRLRSEQALGLSDPEQEAQRLADALGPDARRKIGVLGFPATELNATREIVAAHEQLYPLERMREIEQDRIEKERLRALEPAERVRYGVLAAVFRDSISARQTLTELVDAGYDGELVSRETDGEVLLELRVGPYEDLRRAETAAATIRDMFGLSPRIVIEKEQP